MNTQRWMEAVSGGAAVNAIAKKIGVRQSTLATQLASQSGLKPETAVRIAREYGSDPVVALINIGLLRADEATGVSVEELKRLLAVDMEASRLEGMSDEELTVEVRRLVDEIDRRFAEREQVERLEG